MSIPKIIHYCWFGGAPMPELALNCLDSWKKYCPDYRLICWSENNYNFSAAPDYVRQAYDAKKWAFVTDYVRLQVVYEMGGIYLDTDVELRSSLDPFLAHPSFFGFESRKAVASGLGFGAEAQNGTVQQLLAEYDDVVFLREDGSFDLTPCPVRNTNALLKRGLIADGSMQILPDGTAVYPADYFNPKSFETGRITLTHNTVSIHHVDGSWLTPERKKELEEYRKVTKIFGVSTGERLLLAKKLLKNEGFAALGRRMIDHFKK